MQNVDYAKLAKDFNVDPAAMESLVTYLIRNIQRSEENMIAFLADPEKVMRQGVEAWKKSSDAFFKEMLENTTDRAKTWRNDIISDLQADARKKQDLEA